jgi:hypothetical protein
MNTGANPFVWLNRYSSIVGERGCKLNFDAQICWQSLTILRLDFDCQITRNVCRKIAARRIKGEKSWNAVFSLPVQKSLKEDSISGLTFCSVHSTFCYSPFRLKQQDCKLGD